MTAIRAKATLENILAGLPLVDAGTRVSSKSRYGDDLWDFTSPDTVRLFSVPNSRLRIDWAMYCTVRDEDSYSDHRGALVTREIVEELKVFSYLYLSIPSAIGLRGVKTVKPHTMVLTVRSLLMLFSEVLRSYQLLGLGYKKHISQIRSLADVTLQDIRKVLADSPRVDGDYLKKGLALLANPLMTRALSLESLQWNEHDIQGLAFKFPKKRTDYDKVMPNELFRFLSNTACADVLGFLHLIGLSAHDKSSPSLIPQIGTKPLNGQQLLADYIAIREADREYAAFTGRKQPNSSTLRKNFKSIHGVTPQEAFKWLCRIQRASFTVIGLYTGARYSDLTTFTTGCIRIFHGQPVLAGTHVKHEALDAKQGNDLWPAIPIIRDAVACLEQISKITLNPYLLSGSETVPLGITPQPLSPVGFTWAMTIYLREVDTSSRWADWHLHPHLLRHTLANQLARADVGLIFIAHQMKHLHTALHALPPDVTMMYGNVGELATQRALHSESAYLEAAKELYSPDRPVAGGGAEAFIARRKVYFEGMVADGWTIDELLENLAKQGLPFASVGIGYCGGRRDTLLKDGTKELPPCIGSLQCNPIVCSQAVITKTHEPAWQKILAQNRSLAADQRMVHAKEPLIAAMKAAEQVLAKLNLESGDPLQ